MEKRKRAIGSRRSGHMLVGERRRHILHVIQMDGRALVDDLSESLGISRHPKTHFIVLHVGNFAEDLGNGTENLNWFSNMTVDIAARINELGRQPRTARAFFDRFQDRILFGTDATPHGDEYPQQVFNDALYEIYFRFLETDDEYFDYAPAKVPPQGRWRISGINLPESILRKVYYDNAAHELHLPESS